MGQPVGQRPRGQTPMNRPPTSASELAANSAMNQQNLQPTPILDYTSPEVRQFTDSVVVSDDSELGFLRAAHSAISKHIIPIYTAREFQPSSRTLTLGRGSCSQRLACLESVARLKGIATRVRALWVSGRFWNRRFSLARSFIPSRILLAWPQFYVGSDWAGVEEIFGCLEELAEHSAGFSNDAETLFEAVRLTAVDFDGKTRACSSNCDLSGFIEGRGGVFDARDDLFHTLGALENTWRGRAFELLYGGRKSA